MSKLKYRIVYCSGEEPDYPVTELLSQTPQSRGWQSPKYCEYPMEIAIQFVNGVRVRQIQFLSHHCKISSKIEIYVYMPDKNIPPNHREIKYKKLGYLSLDTNERGGFQARELKSVYIDTPALYMKFLFQKCHINKFNLFNQIGVIALSVFGDPLDAPPGYAQLKPKEFYNEIQFQTQFDPYTLERLRDLEEAKEKAVQREDFIEAKRIKESIERLKQVGVQLRTLEERKTNAIQNEDYDSAAIIKQEIEKIRNTIAPELIRRQEYTPPPSQQHQFGGQQNYAPPTQEYQQPFQPQNRRMQEPNEFFNQPPPPNPQEEMLSHSQFEEKFDPKDMKNRRVQREFNQNHDEQVIPTVLKKQQPQQQDYEEQQKLTNYNLEPLSGEVLQRATPLIPILTEEFCKMIFSKTWGAREDGLKWLEVQINRPTDVNAQDLSVLFVSAMGAINYTIHDKIAAVSQRAVSVLQALLAKHAKLKINKRPEFQEHLDQVILGVMEKLGDNNPRLKEQADQALMMLADHPSIGPLIVQQHLVKGFTNKPKIETSVKHMVGRLQMLQALVKKFEINNAQMPYQSIVDFGVKMVEDKNEPVRTQAILLLVEIYRFVGQRLKQSLGKVRPAQMQTLEEFFNDIDGGGNVVQEPFEQPQIVETNINAQGGNKATKKPPPAKQQQEEQFKQQQSQNTAKCDYCDKVDPQFRDQDQLDRHLWGECPMLVNCSQCTQVVEISDYSQHLLEECKMKRKFKSCPKCREAVLQTGFDRHLEDCKGKSEMNTVRCPLCHLDLKVNQNVWKLHLVKQGCLNNERTAG
ncbi:hypothetical protein pb186bvf_009877 [Paramecium bursaria]